MSRLTRRGRIWYGYVYVNGERKQRTTRCTDRRAAEMLVRQWERDAADPDHAAQSQALIRHALALVLERARRRAAAKTGSPATLDYYRRKVGHLSRLLEPDEREVPLASLTASVVDSYADRRRDEGAAPATVAKELGALGLALRLARRAGLWRGDPAEVLPVSEGAGYVPRQRWLTPDEARALLAELIPDRAARVAWILATGGRWGESERARREDCDSALVAIRGTKTARALRTVPLVLAEQRTLMHHAMAHAEGTGALFVPWGNVRRDLHAACARAGIAPCSPNDLRRSLPHWMRQAGVPAELVALVLGHSTTKLVHQVYANLVGAELGTAIAASMPAEATASPVHQLPRPWRMGRTGRTASGSPLPFESASFAVPRDGIEPPTRGFSIPRSAWPTPRNDTCERPRATVVASPVHQARRRA